MTSKEPRKAGAADGRCPICGAPTEREHRPFCTTRCRDVDLSRWLRGAYAIPGGKAEADEDGEDAAARRSPSAGSDAGDRD